MLRASDNMRITCLIMVCAYLSLTVSTEEVQYLNRLKRVRSREKSVLDGTTARKELNRNTEIRPDVFSILRESRPQGQIQKPFQKNTHESQPSSQQQHSRERSRHPIKRLKVRSIAGSTYEVENEIHEIIHGSVPEVDEGPIYIKPLVRVITQKNIFDSIADVLHQLLDPPKKGPAPIVGPIKMPGSKRKIYLRLLEPVDSSHINVRFVTQLPVPVVDEGSIISREHQSILPFLPLIDPDIALSNRHPIASSDATFSSSNRHKSVQLPPRNVSHVVSKGRGSQPKLVNKLKRPSEDLEGTDEENISPVKVEAVSGAESDKNQLYYLDQSGDDAVKQVTEIIKNATENEQELKDSLESSWYQLSTHRLPLRQIAPLYPLSAMEHTNSDSYENTYKVPSDSFVVPSPHSNSHPQYSNVNAGTSGFYDQSSYAIPSTYAYQKQNEFSNAPSSYSISYQNQNEFNNSPSSTSYIKQNDLFNAPTVHTSSYEKPANLLPTSNSYATSQGGIQTDSSSQNALRVIDPPLYFPDSPKVLENHANKVFEHAAIQQRPNLSNDNGILSLRNNAQNSELPFDQITWGKVKREKSESNVQKNAEIISDDNREKWQPLMFVPEDADWHKAFANLVKVIANDNHHESNARQQLVNRPRQVSRSTTPESTIEIGRVDQRQSGKRHNYSAARGNSKCSISDKEDGCERKESVLVSTPYPEDISKFEEQTQSAANVESIAITPKSVASNTTVKRSNLGSTKSSWIEEPQPLVMTTETLATSSSTTERPLLLIKVTGNTTEKSIENKTTSRPMMINTEKSAAGSTTESSLIGSASNAFIPRNNTRLRFPKRPTIMKKPSFVLKEAESISTTRRTVKASSTTWKPTMGSTTEKMKTMRRLKFQGAFSKTKSSTT